MRVLLTGHKGFIGKNMLQYLEDNTEWHVDTYEWDDGNMPSLMDQDWVIHIGAISSTTERDLDKVLRQNYDFTRQIFNACKTYGVNMQYSSSASLYGMNTEFTEESQLDPITPYAWSKYLCERFHTTNQGGNIVQGFRYFNVYGDNEEHKGTQASPITQFRNQYKKDGVIKVFENSENYKRDFICVTDICRIHVEFIKNVKESGIFNVGTGVARSFQEVADLITPSQIHIPMPENLKRSYQEYTCSDNTKLERVLGKQSWIAIEDFLSSSKQ
jgi:ADP-L-glycero-D-manno-heptose 6-epimerase